MMDTEEIAVTTPNGHPARFRVRPGTSDTATVGATCSLWAEQAPDEYGLRGRTWTGTALDVGAHIGSLAVTLALDNPGLRVVAVEALPENAALLRENVALNRLADRVEVVEGAADRGPDPVEIAYGSRETRFAAEHYWIGGAVWHGGASDRLTVTQPAVPLSSLTAGGRVALLKIDCEGGEWSFLDDPAVALVDEITGEWHPRDGNGPARLHELLDATHEVEVDDTLGFGPFRAVRRATA